jgi:hypothetical protein
VLRERDHVLGPRRPLDPLEVGREPALGERPVGDGQGDSLTFFRRAQNHEVARLGLGGDVGRFDDEERRLPWDQDLLLKNVIAHWGTFRY